MSAHLIADDLFGQIGAAKPRLTVAQSLGSLRLPYQSKRQLLAHFPVGECLVVKGALIKVNGTAGVGIVSVSRRRAPKQSAGRLDVGKNKQNQTDQTGGNSPLFEDRKSTRLNSS